MIYNIPDSLMMYFKLLTRHLMLGTGAELFYVCGKLIVILWNSFATHKEVIMSDWGIGIKISNLLSGADKVLLQ